MSKTIGQRIKELREQRGLTQAELAKLLGCAQTTVDEWERRKDREPSKKFVSAIEEDDDADDDRSERRCKAKSRTHTARIISNTALPRGEWVHVAAVYALKRNWPAQLQVFVRQMISKHPSYSLA